MSLRSTLAAMRQASRDYKPPEKLGVGQLLSILAVVAGLYFARHGWPQ